MAKKAGRKQIKIDSKQVEALASYGCTTSEIASFFSCDKSTISRRFATIITKGKDQGKIRLRKKQFEVAIAGNPAMLIWLGKNVLDQADKQGIEIGGEGGEPIKIEYVPVKKRKKEDDNKAG